MRCGGGKNHQTSHRRKSERTVENSLFNLSASPFVLFIIFILLDSFLFRSTFSFLLPPGDGRKGSSTKEKVVNPGIFKAFYFHPFPAPGSRFIVEGSVLKLGKDCPLRISFSANVGWLLRKKNWGRIYCTQSDELVIIASRSGDFVFGWRIYLFFISSLAHPNPRF